MFVNIFSLKMREKPPALSVKYLTARKDFRLKERIDLYNIFIADINSRPSFFSQTFRIFKLNFFKNCSKNHPTAKILHTFSEKQNNNTLKTFKVKVLTKYTIVNYNNLKVMYWTKFLDKHIL